MGKEFLDGNYNFSPVAGCLISNQAKGKRKSRPVDKQIHLPL
jgi:hypothetical protein